jgi:hypothetical protein
MQRESRRLATFLGAQATAMITVHGDTADPTSFPGGRWPKSNTGSTATRR